MVYFPQCMDTRGDPIYKKAFLGCESPNQERVELGPEVKMGGSEGLFVTTLGHQQKFLMLLRALEHEEHWEHWEHIGHSRRSSQNHFQSSPPEHPAEQQPPGA